MKLSLLIRALLFSLLMNVPALYEYFASGGMSPRIFSDWDEVHYLPLAYIDAGRLLRQISTGDFNIVWLISPLPYHAIEVIFGLFVRLTDINLAALGLVLDLLFVPICYVIFSRAFSYLTKESSSAEFAAFVLLFFPWLFYIRQYIAIPSPFGPEVVAASHSLYPCQPILRAISTEVSYPLFGLSLLSIFQGVGSGYRRDKLFLAGILAGLTNYLYFFAWPALCGFAGVYVLISGIYERQVGKSLRALFSFGIGTLITSSVALWALTRSYTEAFTKGNSIALPIKEDFYFFSPEHGALVILITLFIIFVRPKKYAPLLAIIACLIAEFALMNTQAILKAWTVPYHFPLLYLHPLLSGCSILVLFEVLRSQSIRKIAICMAVAIAALVSTKFTLDNKSVRAESNEFVSMANFIKAKAKASDSVLVVPWENSFKPRADTFHVYLFPYWVNTLTLNPLFMDPVRSGWESMYVHELLTGLIYKGSAQLVAPCPTSPPELPGDMLMGVMTRDYIVRYNFCRKVESHPQTINPCELVRSGTPNYVVWQYNLIKEVPQNIAPVLESVWKAESGETELFHFNQERAHSIFCGSA